MTRVCTKCKTEKSSIDFYSNTKRKSWCISCCRENVRTWQKKNKDRISKYNSEKAKNNPNYAASARERAYNYYKANRDSPNYKADKASREGFRRAYKHKATPKWLSAEQLESIRYTYWLCADLKVTSGESYEVDHIVPLKGKNVCGLHVPWNLQILPANINRTKHNSY